MVNSNGNPVANQFCIHDTEHSAVYFQSYRSLIAEYDGERLTLGRDFDYSVTTVKYLHMWILENCPYTLAAAIDNAAGGSYAAKLRTCIANDIIIYYPLMV
jgi:hypothetical protein